MAANRGYRVQMTVVDQKGYCEAGHKVGDTVLFQLLKVEGQICPSVLACVMPMIHALRVGAEIPWEHKKDCMFYACPDPGNPVTFEIRRVGEETDAYPPR
jgi:uncharacterized repeat protein (TIGR04076 family)